MADDVFAEIHNPASALAGDRRKRLNLESFTGGILRLGRGGVVSWSVYIVRCADGSLYTGIAKDVARRVEEHNSNNLLASNYTRARRPVTLVYQKAVATRSAAGKREYQVKQMSRREKETLIAEG